MKDIRLDSPVEGELVALSAVNDPVFGSGAMGRGAAVRNPKGQVFAPFDGEITVFFETKHAIGMKSEDGVEVLIHVGMDTVKLNGEHFTAKAAQGDKVKKGQLLLEFDPEAIQAAGYETTTPFVVTNAADYGDITVALGDQTVVAKAAADAPAAPKAAAADDHEYDSRPDEQRVAKLIWKYVGGMENVRNAEHCATRLRLIINDKTKIDEKAIENIDGVKGQFFAAAQYQIILGTGFVDKVFDEFIKGTNFSGVSNKEEAYAQMSTVQKISRTLGDVFVPIIPVLVATGLFMGLRGACQALGIEFSKNVLTMSQVLTDTAFIFLPSLVCWSTMKRFGGTPVIGIVLGLMLVAPQLPNAWAAIPGGAQQPMMMDILGFSVPVVGYQGSVLPALVLGIFGAKLQKWLKTFVPDIIDLIVTPFLTLFIAQGGAAAAVAARTKNKKKRALYISSIVPAFLGITEPVIFGINLRLMKPFLYALVGGACAGCLASFMHLAGTGMGITVLPGTLLYLNHLLPYILVNAVGFVVAFALTFTLFKPEEDEA